MTENKQSIASMKYDAKNTMHISIKLNLNYDRDIVDFLEIQPNKQKFIKNLIREEIKRSK